MSDFRLGLGELRWFAWLFLGWCALMTVAALSVKDWGNAFNWALSTFIVCLFVRLVGTVARLRARIREVEGQRDTALRLLSIAQARNNG